jgi:hypothetical protein
MNSLNSTLWTIIVGFAVILVFYFISVLVFGKLEETHANMLKEKHQAWWYKTYHNYRQPNQQLQSKNSLFDFHKPPLMCDAKLRSVSDLTVTPMNDRPSYTEYSPGCPQQYKDSNPDLAISGTGVGEPAYPDVNAFPAPFEKSCIGCRPTVNTSLSIPEPRDEYTDNDFESITYQIEPPKIGSFVCKRSSGLGQPNCEGNDLAELSSVL